MIAADLVRAVVLLTLPAAWLGGVLTLGQLSRDGMRSRVSGAHRTVNYGVRPLGALAGGALATVAGLRPTLVTAAVGGTLSLLWLLPSPIPGIRALEPDDVRAELPAGTAELSPSGTPVQAGNRTHTT
ncbi:hypothetical protein [Streptomyces sp. TRM68367]|uniref:hypothetical protein n=1 Tax=Streptomyces sp. TRM68367 TaxID=2758415 RepID=UPI0021D12A8E|nr:hypothetical protein [Streptomyces sp. TRM68367]